MSGVAAENAVCPMCNRGCLHAAERVRIFEPHGKPIEVRLQTMACDACGETVTSASQHAENLKALAVRKVHYGNLLMGEEILALRKRYGLTQQQASKVFGKGKIAFSRYESETTYPDESTTLLLTMAMERPEVMKDLADRARIDLPLWPERCEDAQRIRVRALAVMRPGAGAVQHDRVRIDVPKGTVGLGRDFAVSASFRDRFSVSACNDLVSKNHLVRVA